MYCCQETVDFQTEDSGTNNSGYVNASEFKLKPETEEAERKVLTAEELPILGKDGKLHDRSEIEKLSKLKALPKDDNVTE